MQCAATSQKRLLEGSRKYPYISVTLRKEVSVTCIEALHVTSLRVIEWKLPSLRAAEVSEDFTVNSCCVFKCTKCQGRDEGVSFFSIPVVMEFQGTKNKELSLKRHQAWISSLNRKDWVPSKSSYVCSKHFLSGKF